jgi:thiol-disulfide isomerase/thioredoxin
MPINKTEFAELEQKISKTGKSALHLLAPEIGKAYVISITRDGCPACKKQKPKMTELEKATMKKHGGKVVFTQIHVKYSASDNTESLRAKDVFGHYFYPTNLILVRTRDRGAIEYYKNASPSMGELRKNIEVALKVATAFEKEAR